MLMILLSTLSVIRHLISGHNYNWLMKLNLIYKTLLTGAGSGLLISMIWKNRTGFVWPVLITVVLLMWKWMGLFLSKTCILRCWGWRSLLNCIRALTLSLLLKLSPKKLEPWFILWSFFLLMLLFISINSPYNYAWNTAIMFRLVFVAAT